MPHGTAVVQNGADKRCIYADQGILRYNPLRFKVRIVYKRLAAFLVMMSTCSFHFKSFWI